MMIYNRLDAQKQRLHYDIASHRMAGSKRATGGHTIRLEAHDCWPTPALRRNMIGDEARDDTNFRLRNRYRRPLSSFRH